MSQLGWDGMMNTLESSGVLRATTEKQHTLLVLESAERISTSDLIGDVSPLCSILFAECLDVLIHLEDLLELLRNLAQALHDLHASLMLAGTVFIKDERHHDHAHELRGVCFGGIILDSSCM